MKNDPILVGSSKVTSRGQITIPQDIRKKYKIDPGDTIYFLEENGKLILKKGPLKLS
ncbi:AbrB/MazE/SpoVT family DNA-binding domain-containing protein [Candidatus Bathyarchaeota archaeon]|nr:AbrB/MazE/SpoVT family DNA-binding domain-containing protein [Candidatus Bathyarchaeota archaeon]